MAEVSTEKADLLLRIFEFVPNFLIFLINLTLVLPVSVKFCSLCRIDQLT